LACSNSATWPVPRACLWFGARERNAAWFRRIAMFGIELAIAELSCHRLLADDISEEFASSAENSSFAAVADY
jgi:hypothetical protein